MIKTNLSTRPFYNERAVHLALLIVAVVVAAATAWNMSRILRYSRSDTRLATQASRDEVRAADLRQQAVRLRASVDPQQVQLASAGARQANDLIDRRTFSWTELLNRFETTLPDEVQLTAIRPSVDRDKGIMLRLTVMARGVDDVAEFMEKLEATGAFKDVRPATDQFNEQGLLLSILEMSYVPSAGKPSAKKAADENTATGRGEAEKPASDAPPVARGGGAPGR